MSLALRQPCDNSSWGYPVCKRAGMVVQWNQSVEQRSNNPLRYDRPTRPEPYHGIPVLHELWGSSPPPAPARLRTSRLRIHRSARKNWMSVACITSHSFSTWNMFNAPLRGFDSAALRLQKNTGFVEDRQFGGRIVIRSARHSLDAFIIQQQYLQRAYSRFGKPMKHGGSCVTWALSAAATLADNFNPALKSKWSFARGPWSCW